MSAEERRKILQMVEDGKISADEAVALVMSLTEDEEEMAEAEGEVAAGVTGDGSERSVAPEFERIKKRVRRLALISLWTGVAVSLLSAWAVYAIHNSAGTNFWFYCMFFPLMFGVLLIALGGGGRTSRWVFVDVDRSEAKENDGPRHIRLGFPLPLGLAAWFFDHFGKNLKGMRRDKVEGMIQIIQAAKDTDEPLIVHVDDDERVQVYIG
jgi:hypothetical protein